MEKAKRVVWRLLAASVCVMAVSQAVHADSLDEQRNRYAQIKQAWDNKQMAAWLTAITHTLAASRRQTTRLAFSTSSSSLFFRQLQRLATSKSN